MKKAGGGVGGSDLPHLLASPPLAAASFCGGTANEYHSPFYRLVDNVFELAIFTVMIYLGRSGECSVVGVSGRCNNMVTTW